jgi:hypothetical protein
MEARPLPDRGVLRMVDRTTNLPDLANRIRSIPMIRCSIRPAAPSRKRCEMTTLDKALYQQAYRRDLSLCFGSSDGKLAFE